jgi:hypothetical protein
LFALEDLQVLNLSTLYFLLSTLYWPSANGGWRTRIELFVTEIGKWIPCSINLVGNSPDRSNEKLN